MLHSLENGMGLIDPNGRVSIFPFEYARNFDVSARSSTATRAIGHLTNDLLKGLLQSCRDFATPQLSKALLRSR